jgi:hypothetical protein
VRYRHGEAASTPPVERVVELRPEALAAVPAELRAELRDALIALNAERIAGILERVTERDAALGAMLASRASRFAYTEILVAIEAGSASGQSATMGSKISNVVPLPNSL